MTYRMKILFFSIYFFIQRVSSTNISKSINVKVDVNQECRIIKESISFQVFFGWPLSIPCNHVFSELENSDYQDYEEISTHRPNSDREFVRGSDNATCIIWDLDERRVILNKTVDFPNVFYDLTFNIVNFNQTNSLNYLIKAWVTGKENSCIGAHLSLSVGVLPKLTCEESINTSELVELRTKMDRSLELSCIAPLIRNSPSHSNYTITWYKNCEHLPEQSSISGKSNNTLKINRITFEHPGVYSCEVVHNGMRRYFSHYKTCVYSEKSRGEKKIHCTKRTYHTTIGKSLVVECEGNHKHFLQHSHMHVLWKKNSLDYPLMNCSNHFKDAQRKAFNSNATCSFHFNHVCFHKVPSQHEIENAGEAAIMRLVFKNIQENDFGNYTITVSSGSKTHAYFTIERSSIAGLMETATAVGICAAIFLFCLVMCAVLWRHKFVYIKWKWKQIFGILQPDDKLYGAYLSYYFSTNMDKFSKEQTRDAVSAVRAELVALGYSIYEELKDGIYIEMRAESTLEYIKQSHRVVIILNSEFLKDPWNNFSLQRSFEEMIRSNFKLIFIMLPGMKAFIKQHSIYNDKIRMVQAAIKSNYAIEWSNDKHFDIKKFSMLMELAMPKLRTRFKGLRRTSTSSSLGSQHTVLYKKPFRRTMSNETGTTELGSPTSTDGHSVEFDVETERNR